MAFGGAAQAVPKQAFPDPIVGTPKQVLEVLAPMFEKSPFTHLVVNFLPYQPIWRRVRCFQRCGAGVATPCPHIANGD